MLAERRISANRLPASPVRSTVGAVEATDALLSARLRAGDSWALAEAFDAHCSAVYAVALGVVGSPSLAQDVVQDVFLELWSHPDRYDAEMGRMRTYLSMCARHRAIDVLRSELRRIGREDRHQALVPQPREALPAEVVAEAETTSAVRRAVRVLPEVQRQVVELAYFDGLSYREVARALAIPEGTAKSRMRLALMRLHLVLDRQLLEPS